MIRYKTVFTREALDFICRASQDEMRELESWLDRIERQPGLAGDYFERDLLGRKLQVATLRYTAVTYRTDDAAQEVRIVRIESSP